MTTALTDLSLEHLTSLVTSLGFKPFTASQLVLWLYRDAVGSFEEMTNLPKAARAVLQERFAVDPLEPITMLQGSDGTRKFLWKLRDGQRIESVLIPSEDGERLTACVSSQVGCAMACDFCRTGMMGLKRNLTLGEITSQLRLMKQKTEKPITNVVFMGMGEPLTNFQNVCDSITFMSSENAFGLGKRRITVSTSGLIPQLKRFCERFDVKIAISLSAANDELRDKLMPINKRYPIAELMQFCREYSEQKRHTIMFEYVLIKGVNDSQDQAERLVQILKGVRAKVNLIPFNPFEESEYKRPDSKVYEWWSKYLWDRGIPAPIRISGGRDILAACGQLATAEKKEKK
ncbi:MAG: 23S rRNA (adenine(2503)-C(2))-methyltransferase RlmN [Deltaproteobacteria bacterium]|nr:23S rRNA (adenine(2503)-C(2))-methyltransferase RlmN [Deltaproteobacteria bacterium]